jgi:hypothetical protein
MGNIGIGYYIEIEIEIYKNKKTHTQIMSQTTNKQKFVFEK